MHHTIQPLTLTPVLRFKCFFLSFSLSTFKFSLRNSVYICNIYSLSVGVRRCQTFCLQFVLRLRPSLCKHRLRMLHFSPLLFPTPFIFYYSNMRSAFIIVSFLMVCKFLWKLNLVAPPRSTSSVSVSVLAVTVSRVDCSSQLETVHFYSTWADTFNGQFNSLIYNLFI